MIVPPISQAFLLLICAFLALRDVFFRFVILMAKPIWNIEWVEMLNSVSTVVVPACSTFQHFNISYSCSSANVLVVWSQTSAGPQYWIGPG